MTTLAAVLLGVTVAVALLDWWAVATAQIRLEWIFKPLTMVALIGTTLALDFPVESMFVWLIAALVFSMLGDIFLIPHEEKWFVPGLASFLIAHVMYVVAFWKVQESGLWQGVGGVIMVIALLSVGPTLLSYSRKQDPVLPYAITAYMLTIAAMLVVAFGTGSWLAMVGAVLFCGSDMTIGFTAFVQPIPHQRMIIITSYHAAQIALILSALTVG